MDEHGLPIVGAGVDYTKVDNFDNFNRIIDEYYCYLMFGSQHLALQ